MTPRTGRLIGLGFAGLWLWLGATALARPWSLVAGIGGALAIAGLALVVLRRVEERRGRFDMRRYGIAVAVEIAAIWAVTFALQRVGAEGYMIPVVGIIVGLHFVVLWWAGGGTGFLKLAGAMTAIDAGALLLPAGSAAMQAVAGLGSGAALALAAGLGNA